MLIRKLFVADDFEVAVFLTETSTRHSILRKEKRVKSEKGRLGTTNGRLTGTKEAPVEVGESAPGLLREESDEDSRRKLDDVPAASGEEGTIGQPSLPKVEGRDELFVSDGEEDGNGQPKTTARKQAERDDDKKKLAMKTTYDGFSIYGRILCLVVKRRGTTKSKEPTGGSGQAMMEEWIASTQMGEGQLMDE